MKQVFYSVYKNLLSITKKIGPLVFLLFLFCMGCGGTYDYKVQKVPTISVDKKMPGNACCIVATEDVYNHSLGFYNYKLHVQDGVKKYYEHLISQTFEDGIGIKPANINLVVTAIDTSIFPIASLIIDVRIFFKVEIFNKEMKKEKTVMIYGFGSDPDGNRALEKAIANSYYQLLPYLEELFIRQ